MYLGLLGASEFAEGQSGSGGILSHLAEGSSAWVMGRLARNACCSQFSHLRAGKEGQCPSQVPTVLRKDSFDCTELVLQAWGCCTFENTG
jgi:hypothetical protein